MIQSFGLRMIDLAGKACCVCSTNESELLWTATWPEHRYPGRFSMRRCKGCGLMFNSPRLDDAELGQLYGRNYYFFQRRDSRELRRIVPMYQRTIGLVAERIEPKRVLDIGCGRGYLPIVLKRLEWEAEGIEISSDAADYARQCLGLDVFRGTIEEYVESSQAETFPLVTAIDVLEHVPCPDAFLAAATRAVAPTGRLIIDTPNAASANIQVKGVQWQGFNPFHIYLFTIPTLRALLAKHQFEIELAFSYHNRPAADEPLALRARDALARRLKRIGLIRPAVAVYFKLKQFGPAGPDMDRMLARVVDTIRSSRKYFDTPDANAPLAADARGDNIVVVARRAG